MPQNEYTILEYAKLHNFNLKRYTRRKLGINANKLGEERKIEKKWKPEEGCRPKGARLWPEDILYEIFFGKSG